MGNESSVPVGVAGPGQAEDLLRSRMQEYNPFATSVPGGSTPAGQEEDSKRTIRATEAAPPLDARAIAISAAAHLMEPERFQWAFLQGECARAGMRACGAKGLCLRSEAQNETRVRAEADAATYVMCWTGAVRRGYVDRLQYVPPLCTSGLCSTGIVLIAPAQFP